MTNLPKLLGLFLPCFIIQGCSMTKEPDLTVQMCVVDQNGMSQFLEKLVDFAKSEKLLVLDGSKQTSNELKAVKADRHLKYDVSKTINMSLQDGNDTKVMIGNLGLPTYQIVISFFDDADAVQKHTLSNRFVQTLPKHWEIETVPAGRGAFPMKSCGG